MDVDLFVEQLEYSLRGLFPCCLCWCHRSDTNGICLCSDGGRSKRKHLDDGCNSFALCGRHFKFGARILGGQHRFCERLRCAVSGTRTGQSIIVGESLLAIVVIDCGWCHCLGALSHPYTMRRRCWTFLSLSEWNRTKIG